MDDNVFSEIKKCLGTPFYENDFGVLYNTDCHEAIKLLANAGIHIDATITSPPYNIGKEYETIQDNELYLSWLTNIMSDVYDITSPSGSLLLNLGYFSVPKHGRAVPISYLFWDRLKFFLQQEIVWNYGAGVACKNYLSPRNEKILWYVKDSDNYIFNLDDIRDPDVKYPNQKKNGKLRCNTLGKNPSDVWQIAKVTSGASRSSKERTTHPAQFPEDLISRLVKGFTNKSDLILEPFSGSGTVAVVAMKYGRKFLAFEIDSKYCTLSAKRIQSEYNNLQSDLFFECS